MSPYIYLAAAMLVVKRMPTRHFPIQYNRKFSNFFAYSSVFIGPNNLKFGTKTRSTFLLATSEFGSNLS